MTGGGVSRRPLSSTAAKRLHRDWNRRTQGRLAVLLDGVMSPYNVGSIARLAAAYRADWLLLAGAAVSPSHPGARKTALGTDRFLRVERFPNVVDAAAAARAEGLRIVGLELAEGATPLFEVALPPHVCVAVGHEDHGLSQAGLAACDVIAYLPLIGRVGSLNVATATAIALYEARRQEWSSRRDMADGPDLDP
jgi:tRNA (guanosine-2'-O-)-methyltransferase